MSGIKRVMGTDIYNDINRAWAAIDELQGFLSWWTGSIFPRRIPVNVFDGPVQVNAREVGGGSPVNVETKVNLDQREIGKAAARWMTDELRTTCKKAGDQAATSTPEAREQDILLRAEAVEALREIRRGWNAIGETGGVDGVEIKSGRNDPAGWNPRIYLPTYRKLEAPLRQLAAEWMARFIVAAEALCLDVIERGAAAIPEKKGE